MSTHLHTTDGACVVVCGPDSQGWRKRYWWCPTCECRTENVAQIELWYGLSSRCCRCGDAWSDCGMRPRPFARHWRRGAVSRSRRLWDAATFGPFPSLHELDPRTFPAEASEPLCDVEPRREAFVRYEREEPTPVLTESATRERL